MRRASSFTIALLLGVTLGSGLAAQEAELSQEEIVERVLELRRELDALLAALPPELRAEVERRLAESGEVDEVAVEAPVEAPVESGAPSAVSAPHTTAPAAAETCAELAVFDTDGDGSLSGFDRHWRFFRLWRDDGDGAVEPAELTKMFDAGVRRFSSRLRTYETADGVRGDVRLVGGWITFERVGKKGDSAQLVIDADRLRRGGELELVDAGGVALAGMRRLGESSLARSADGAVTRLACP